MSLQVRNLVKVELEEPKLGEALKSVQQYVNNNVEQAAGNYQAPPHLSGLTSINPTKPAS
jgi:hypothetical protein